MHEAQLTKIITGYMPGLNNRLILFDRLKEFLSFQYVVINCIDSSPDVSEMQDILDGLNISDCKFEKLGTALLVEVDSNALKYIINTFTGFDELLFYKTRPKLYNPPPWLTSESSLVKTDDEFNDRLQEWKNWMRTSECTLGMGDGCGVNFVTVDPAWILCFSSESS